jgi:solute carrier family 35 protein F1/2
MDSKTADTKTTAIETHDRALENGEDYRRSSDGLEINEHGNGTTETNSDELRAANSGGEAVDAVVLEQAIEALESKKTKWYAYMTTKEFWAVLLLGYALFYVFMAGY